MQGMLRLVPGFIMFAAIMMAVIGIFQAISGLSAIFDDDFFVVTGDYVFKFNTTAWGWIHLVYGIILVASGINLLRGRQWAVAIALIVVAVSTVQNFMFIPYYPVWSILIIAIEVVIIWSLAVYGQVLGEEEPSPRP